MLAPSSTLQLELAIPAATAITLMHRPGCPEKLTLRADVEVALPIEGKVRARQDAFFPLAHVPNRNVRCDPGADNPMEELASAVRRVGGEPVGLEPQSLLCPLDHRLCRSDLVVAQIEAQLADAKWDLNQTTVRAPADGIVTLMALTVGDRALQARAVMSFIVTDDIMLIGMFPANGFEMT